LALRMGFKHFEQAQGKTMETNKSANPGQEVKNEGKQQKAKLRKDKRELLLQQNKDHKWKSFFLGALFFILDIFD